MKRRDLLRLSMAGALGATIPGLGGKYPNAHGQPRAPFVIMPIYDDDPLTLEGRDRSILVIGGGLAGLSASLELAERGYKVTLQEANDVLGGRLATRDLSTAAGDFRVEHGLHMWFDNYHQFKDIRERLDINDSFAPHNETHFTYRDYKDEILTSDPPIYPLNLIKLLERSPNLNLFSAFRQLGLLGDVLFYDHKSIYDRLDDTTFDDWASGKVSDTFYDILLQPAASVTLNDPTKVSAAEMVSFTHFYMMSQPKAMWREVTKTDHATAVIDPWVERLRSLGVEIKLNTPCEGLRVSEDRVVGVVNDETNYDGVVLATSVPGVKSILGQSRIEESSNEGVTRYEQMQEQLTQLKVAPPYKVVRAWFDRPTRIGRPDILETPQHKPVNLVTLFHLLEEESKDWAAQTNGSVLEFHLYADERWGQASDEEVWNAIKPILDELYPELADANLIDMTVGTYRDFTSFEVGQGQIRPRSNGPSLDFGVEGLALAGDWVYTDYPCALMEKAVSTGREAANHFLLKDRVRLVPIKATSCHGPGLVVI